MNKSTSLSRSILKLAGVFGGTQFATIIGTVVRTKLVALWIGEAGVGLFGILTAGVDFISSLTQLNLRNSSVREISEARSRSAITLSHIISAVRKWGWILGILGAAVMLAASPLLSTAAFGNPDCILPFALLSIAVLLNSASESERAVLQGLALFPPLARASLWGVVGGCIISIPAIYLWRIDSVAPVILIYSAVTFAATYIMRAKPVDTAPPLQHRRITSIYGRRFIRLGFYLTLAGSFSWGAGLLLLSFLNHRMGLDALGAYQAGYTIAMRYVSFLFSAFAMEYFPRMAAVSTNGNRRMQVFMRHQTIILCRTFLAAALAIALGAPLIVDILYSSRFSATVPMIILAAPSLVLRAASWCIAFVILAKGDGPAYLLCESLSTVTGLILNIVGYYLAGIKGIGLSYVAWYFIYLIIVAVIVHRRYSISLGGKATANVVGVLLISVAATIIGYMVY